MNKIFLDTDVVIDFLTDRQPHSDFAYELFKKAENGEVLLCISALSVNNIFYICRKLLGKKQAISVIEQLIPLVVIQSVGNQEINHALVANGFRDFEDAIQYYCALEIDGIEALITRNVKDYRHSTLSVFTPETYLKSVG